MDLTRDSDITVIERIRREPDFVRALLHEVSLGLLNRKLDEARRTLLVLVKGTINFDPTGDLTALLTEEGKASLQQLNGLHDALWKHHVASDLSLSGIARINWRPLVEKWKDEPDEGCITAMSPEIYREIYGDKTSEGEK